MNETDERSPPGSPAFPCPTPHSDTWMTLRDYFAAAAMPVVGYRMDLINANWTADRIAAVAYQIADAMIKARDQEATMCEHGIADGDWCSACRQAYREAETENK